MNKHPLVLACILFFAGGVAASVIGGCLKVAGVDDDLGYGLGRIAAAVVLMICFHSCFSGNKAFRGALLTLPVIAYVIWNVVGAVMNGHPLKTGAEIPVAVILAIAPAMLEETVFRGILITKLLKNGATAEQTATGSAVPGVSRRTEWFALLASSALFGAVHLINLTVAGPPTVLLQVGYSAVIGLFFGAVYIRSRDILSVMIGHAAVDLSSLLFVRPTETTFPLPWQFYALMAGTVICSILIMTVNRKDSA